MVDTNFMPFTYPVCSFSRYSEQLMMILAIMDSQGLMQLSKEEDIRKHCKTCATCQLHKLENVKFKRKIFKPSLQPMDFICMDLIGEFHPPTSRGHCYTLTAVCMLTGFTWCVPLKTKTAEEVAKAYMDHIYCSFGGSIKILADNGTEFKNKLFKEVVSKLGMEFSIHSPPYRP